ncbi:hypothetical protein BOX15_Mlig024288g1 [Macrostomum lignano]|uniref:MFS domain-containing protein n=1 Tax=Macrostomum lignano TaxID=282301 RepID=A0A267EB78_9PLAT|nr:hypothetical protein BOX15_Mlig024288g1 [Macrostomum lignano]
MPPNPLKNKQSTTEMKQSSTKLDEIDNGYHGESLPCQVSSVADSSMPHVNTLDPLICSDQSVISPDDAAVADASSDGGSGPALSTGRRVLYGLAAPPSAMCGNILGFLMSVYLLEVAKLTPGLVLTITFTGRFWDAVSDPIVGYLVSRTRTRFGKCRPWVLGSAPFCGLAFFLFFNTPSWQSLYARFAYYFIVYLGFCTFLTMYHIPYTSMTMLISNRPADRDAATTLRMIFEMLGTLCGVMTFTFITQHGQDSCQLASIGNLSLAAGDPEPSPVPADGSPEVARYRLGGTIIASVVCACGLVGFVGTREVPAAAVESPSVTLTSPPIERHRQQTVAACCYGMLSAFKRCLRHRSYRQLMLTFMLSSLAIQTVQNSLALYTIYSLQMKPHLKFAIAIVMSMAILATPLVFLAIKRVGKKRVFYVGLFLILPVCLSATFCPADDRFVPLYYVTMLVAGCFVSVNMLLPWVMLPDVIDDYTAATGRSSDQDSATFYSLYVFFNKFAVGISTACLQLALHLTGYRQSEACSQSAAVAMALRCIIGPLPMLLVAAAFLALFRYPITPEYRAQLDKRLAEARLNGAACGTEMSQQTSKLDGDAKDA